ncbi:hypothetical protein AMK68_00705 [candidate division KD3-62 bacterium DG_56]|uniref:Fibronectin type-III domain-containing protein n=1 Tax=candidate division KD3-62 bacterium DG_56 TaxID=1704032 RepID=A0A0S7XQF7_9BACT|nr:MAG: hypothetical protein AMK68_00705 [candidate division KD3-62 bacterium DG_56]
MSAPRTRASYLISPTLLALALAFFVGSARAVTITYGPIAALQDPAGGGPPTSVVAYWRTNTATSANTAYVSETPSGPWTFVGTDSASSTRHEALVTGLTGDRAYYMYVESATATSPVIQFRTGENLLVNGSLETWHSVSGQGWGTEEPDGWHGWEIYPWSPPGSHNPDHISISMDRATGIPTPEVKDGSHRVGMDEGWRSCYGGIYQEVTGLAAGDYTVSGWAAWLFSDNDYYDRHELEILAKDGAHSPGAAPTGTVIFSQNAPDDDLNWMYVEGTVSCTTGTLTVYANLRSDDHDGTSFVHFDGMRLMSAYQPAITFSNFQFSRVVNGSAYDITLTYETDVAATTQVEWGTTASYGNTTPLDSDLVTEHVVELNAVPPAAAPYHYRANATAPPDLIEFSADKTFDAPLIEFSAISSVVDSGTGTICNISWNTNFATATNRAFYRVAGSGPYTEVADGADPTPRTSHTVTLTGLSLGTQYEYYLESGGADMIPATSSMQSFETPTQPGAGIQIGMAMVGGDIPDGGDDVGPANEVQDMIERDSPIVTVSGMASTSWAQAQPTDPGGGPDVYDWSSLDAKAANLITGKALLTYQQIWGSYPGWVELDTPRFWEKYEDFLEAMTVYINENYGTVYYTFENEPNISRAPDGWNWADWYIHCLEHFYAAVHRANAQTGMENKVIAGNLCGHSAGGFNDLYSRGLKNCSDILGYHPYPYDIRDGVEVADLAQIHGIQVNYGDGDKKIWVSEGWGSGRSAGFDRSSPLIEPPAQEVENMWLAMTKGWDNVMTPRENWHPDYLWGMKFFCGNDNWGAMNWRKRAIPIKDGSGNITGFIVDGYHMTPDIAPYFWNGGMMDFYGNSKDCLMHVFPGDGLVFMNPGFELPSEPPNGHCPHFWTTNADPAPSANYALDDTILHGGSRSLRLTQSTFGDAGVYQMSAKRSALPGVSYRARVWCKTEGVSNLGAWFYMRFSDIDGSQQSAPYWAPTITGTADWTQVEVVATAPSYTSRIEVGCSISGIGTAWFDDVTISMTSQQEVGDVRGYTLDEGQIPVPYCIVRTTAGGHQAISDANGYYEMHDVATGTYDFVCRKSGYVPHRVKNQTVAAGKLTFVSFNMGIPKAGLTVTEVVCDKALANAGEPVSVTVTVANSKPYPNNISEVNVFVEQGAEDATEMFSIDAAGSNPDVIGAYGQSQFLFTLTPRPGTEGRSFSINAYAFGQEDRPNMLQNGDFDEADWVHHWSFTGGADTLIWQADATDFYSAPRSLRCYVADDGYTWNWANNYSAYGVTAPPAYPARNYTVGVHHKDNITGGVSVDLFIQEFYYNGSDWLYNGRRFAAVPHRTVWAHDVMMYDTGDPNVTEGLYATNRLVISCGPCTSPTPGSGFNWWDDLYVKETGDWLADDRATTGASLTVTEPTATSPEGWLKAGWNMISLPLAPANPDPAEVFKDESGTPIAISGNLHRYNHAGAGYVTYHDFDPSPFGEAGVEDGYWLHLSAPTTISYMGSGISDVQLHFLTTGWYLIGCPTNGRALDDIQVTNEGESRTVSLYDAMYTERWIGTRLYWYDASRYSYAACGFDPWCDTDSLATWAGYWIYCWQDNLILVMP